MKRRWVALTLVFVLTLAMSAPALAWDYHDFCQYPLADGDVTVSVITRRDDVSGTDVENIWFWKWISQATGINFEVEQVLGSAMNERKSLLFASGDLPDLIYGFSLSTIDLVKYGQTEGMLMDLKEYVTPEIMPNACQWQEEYPDAFALATTPDGAMYTLPWLYGVKYIWGESSRFFYNEAIMHEIGIEEVPQTLDGFVDMLYAVKEAYPDMYPLGGGYEVYSPVFYFLNALGFLGNANNNGLDITVRDGEAVLPVGDPLYKEILTMFRQFYVDGIISPDFFTLDNTQMSAAVMNDEVFTYAYPPFTVNADYDFWSRWNSVYPLTSEYNDEQQWLKFNPVTVGNVCISSTSEYAELLCRVFDFLYSDVGTIMFWYGPMNGTEDTLGMTEGWAIDENNGVYWPECNNGTYENFMYYAYQVGCGVSGGGAGNHTYSLGQNGIPADLGMYNVMRYLWGNETIAEDGYDPKSPSEGFRLQMQKTISPYEITGFPAIVYYDEDTSYRMNELSVMLGDRMDAEIAKFIVGERSLDEFDTFVEELEALGLREYEGYFQDAYANYLASSN